MATPLNQTGVGSSPDLVERANGRPLLLIGAPIDGSGTARGEIRAPERLRAAGLGERLGEGDFGDLSVEVSDPTIDREAGIRGYRELVAASSTISDAIASALSAGWRPLLVGGCCSVLPGAVAGARRYLGPIGLVFVDGHLDLYDASSSGTGEAGGMALGIVLGHGPESLTGLAGEVPLVAARDVIAIGDGDRPNRIRAQAPPPSRVAPDLCVIEGAEVARRGPESQGAEVAARIGGGSVPFWLHLDFDVIDAAALPAVTHPVTTGLSWDGVGDLLLPLLRSPRLVGLSVSGYNPDQERGEDQAVRIVELLARGLVAGRQEAPGR